MLRTAAAAAAAEPAAHVELAHEAVELRLLPLLLAQRVHLRLHGGRLGRLAAARRAQLEQARVPRPSAARPRPRPASAYRLSPKSGRAPPVPLGQSGASATHASASRSARAYLCAPARHAERLEQRT